MRSTATNARSLQDSGEAEMKYLPIFSLKIRDTLGVRASLSFEVEIWGRESFYKGFDTEVSDFLVEEIRDSVKEMEAKK